MPSRAAYPDGAGLRAVLVKGCRRLSFVHLDRVRDDRYRITLAVADFTRDEIGITMQLNLLLVAG